MKIAKIKPPQILPTLQYIVKQKSFMTMHTCPIGQKFQNQLINVLCIFTIPSLRSKILQPWMQYMNSFNNRYQGHSSMDGIPNAILFIPELLFIPPRNNSDMRTRLFRVINVRILSAVICKCWLRSETIFTYQWIFSNILPQKQVIYADRGSASLTAVIHSIIKANLIIFFVSPFFQLME